MQAALANFLDVLDKQVPKFKMLFEPLPSIVLFASSADYMNVSAVRFEIHFNVSDDYRARLVARLSRIFLMRELAPNDTV
jgi:hypothetical protein